MRTQQPGEVAALLDRAEAARRAGHWVAGFVAYEAALDLPVCPPAAGRDVLWLGVYAAPEENPSLPAPQPIALSPPQPGLGRAAHRVQVEKVRALIREGEMYQANLTFPLAGTFRGQPLDLYARLAAAQPVPYGAFLATDTCHVVSLSPELFFRVAGRRIRARPMKGTLARADGQDDRARRAWLAEDAKNRAENLMIVDLLRNDLSRLCQPGSVRVPALFQTELHPTLIQMTSTVEGRLEGRAGLRACFEALFPCGSVTGAPKRRAMQHLAAIEGRPRGVYCGAIGYAAPHDEMAFSVPIRTLEIAAGTYAMGVGSGIVWDSEADAEYDECLLKGRFLDAATR